MNNFALYFQLLLVGIALYPSLLNGQTLTGTIQAQDTKEALSYVNIYTEAGKGTYSDAAGEYSIEVDAATDSIYYRLLGYKTEVRAVGIAESQVINVAMIPEEIGLEVVEISGRSEKLGKKIIQRVIDAKAEYIQNDQTFSAECYRNVVSQYYYNPSKQDTIDTIAGWRPAALFEEFAIHAFDQDKYKKEVLAELNNCEDDELKRYSRFAIDENFNGGNTFVQYNPLDIFLQPKDIFVNLYDNSWYNPNVSDRPITSPISDGAMLNYSYLLKAIKVADNGDSLFTIAVNPIFKKSPCYSGTLVVNGNTNTILSADLSLDNAAVQGIKDFTLFLEYTEENLATKPTRIQVHYAATLGQKKYQLDHKVEFKDYNFDPQFSKGYFSNEVVTYRQEALERNVTLWKEIRPFELDSTLTEFVRVQDSIYIYEHSDAYYKEQDSIYNNNTVVKYLFSGFGWKNRSKGITTFFNPAVSMIQLSHLGGVRLNVGGMVEKEFLSAQKLDVRYDINYGFVNSDLKARATFGYTYLPKRFARLYFGLGDMYDIITFNQTFEALISPRNLINVRNLKVGHSMEVVNGLYLDASVEYATKESIGDIVLPTWSEELFGEFNQALIFPTYTSLFINAEFIYKFKQKYITRGPRKLILSNRLPTVKLAFRVGVPGFFDSEVNFSKVQFDIYQRPKPTKFGSTNWRLTLGAYPHTKNIRFVEHQYFRGENFIFFSDPLQNLQLLDNTLNTSKPYLQAGVVHHFDGFLLDKIPIINLLQMEVIGGAGVLGLVEGNYAQLELYAGLGKKFKLFKETIQVAVYRVNAIDSDARKKNRYVVGFNIYDPFNGQWDY